MKDKDNYLYTNQLRVHELLTFLTVVLPVLTVVYLFVSVCVSEVGVD